MAWAATETVFLWQYDGSSTYGDGKNGVYDISNTNGIGTVKFVTYEGKKTSADGTVGYNASVVDDDLKPSITKACKLGNNGAHIRISPASGNFQAGDVIYVCGYVPVLITTSSDPTSTAKITTDTGEGGATTVIASSLTLGASKSSCAVGSVTLPENFDENEIYISRVPSTSVGIVAIKVVRPTTNPPTITTDLSATADVTVEIAQEFSIVASDATSYQWYSNTTNSTEGATEIDGATSATYSYTATAQGIVYLYCVATNANGSINSAICAVTATNPPAVTAATIDGATSAYDGIGTTYTATAENATAFAWYVDGIVQDGQTSATFVYTPNAVGNHAIYCTATNNYTETPIQSNTISVSVSAIYGEIIKATLTSGTAATVTGIIGGTADVSLSSSQKLDNNKYFGISLANGKTFYQGDTVIITMTKAGSNYPCLFEDKERTNVLHLATAGSSDLEYKIVLPAAANGINTVYLSRNDDANYKWNPVLSAISVVRPMPEKSRVSVLTGATIDGVALAEADLNSLKSAHTFASSSQFANAPVVKFYTSVTVTYEDDSHKVLNDSVVVTAVENGDLWQAQAEISAETYTITAVHPVSFTVTYMYGETILGEETVIAGENPAKYEDAQKAVQLMACNGWFSDALLSNAVTIESAIITQDTTFYGSFSPLFATSINIEQLVLDNGKSYGLMAQMGTQHYSSNLTNDLDSLNDTKTKRNEPYLGQKVKAAGKLLDFRVAAGSTVKVKFGNIGDTTEVSINGGAYAKMVITEGVYTYTAEENVYLSIKTVSGSTVVFKQIMIDEDIQDVELPVSDQFTLGINGYSTYANNFKYTVTGATVYKAALNAQNDAVVLTEVSGVIPANAGVILKGEEDATVTILAKPDDSATTLTDNALVGVPAAINEFTVANAHVIATQADEGETEATTKFYPYAGTSFPAHKAYLVITDTQDNAPVRIVFAENNTTDINSLEASEKAQKFFENGNLYILRDGVVYDATGRVVR